MDGETGLASESNSGWTGGAAYSSFAIRLKTVAKASGSISGTVGAVGTRATPALTPGVGTWGGVPTMSVGECESSRSSSGAWSSGVLMVVIDRDAFEHSNRIVREHSGGAIERDEVRRCALVVDSHQANREAR